MNTPPLSILLLLNIRTWVVSSFCLLWLTLPFVLQVWEKNMFYFFLGKHLGEELLGFRVDVCLILWETARPISKVLVWCPPPAAVYESSSDPVSSPALGMTRLRFMDSSGDRQWNIAVVAICISLMTTTDKHLPICLLIICILPFMRWPGQIFSSRFVQLVFEL